MYFRYTREEHYNFLTFIHYGFMHLFNYVRMSQREGKKKKKKKDSTPELSSKIYKG